MTNIYPEIMLQVPHEHRFEGNVDATHPPDELHYEFGSDLTVFTDATVARDYYKEHPGTTEYWREFTNVVVDSALYGQDYLRQHPDYHRIDAPVPIFQHNATTQAIWLTGSTTRARAHAAFDLGTQKSDYERPNIIAITRPLGRIAIGYTQFFEHYYDRFIEETINRELDPITKELASRSVLIAMRVKNAARGEACPTRRQRALATPHQHPPKAQAS